MIEAPPLTRSAAALTAFLVALSGCDSPSPTQNPGGRLAIDVAPLSLPGVRDACYSLTVRNGADEIVSAVTLSSSRYGDGAGAASYISPCDASLGYADNTISLEVLGLYEGTVADCAAAPAGLDFEDPGVLVREFTCREDEDVAVTFELSLMRPASQGFFDVAVSFADIYCSAKFDCAYDDGSDMELLFDASGARAPTAVFAVACTGGPDTATRSGDTTLHLDDLTVDCGGTPATVVIDPSAGRGNLYSPPKAPGSAILYQAHVTAGLEPLVNDATGLSTNKAYWTVALGVDLGALATASPAGCNVTTTFTASRGINDATWTPPGVYPVIHLSVPLTLDGAGGLACGGDDRHGLDETLEQGLDYLETGYPATAAPLTRCARDDGAGALVFCSDLAAPDPFAPQTALLLHMDGATFVDEYLHAVVAEGGATPTASAARFGDGGLAGTTTQHLRIPANSDFDLSDQDFTLEGWLRPASNTRGGVFAMRPDCYTYAGVTVQQDPGAGGAPQLLVRVTGVTNAWQISPTVSSPPIPTELPLGQWSHFALVRSGDDVHAYINGVETLLSLAYPGIVNGAGNDLTIGRLGNTVTPGCPDYSGYDGDLDEWRLTVGVARYPARVEPELPPTVGPYTTLLLHMDGPAGSTTFTDEVGHTVTSVNGAAISATAKAGSGSVEGDVPTHKALQVTHAADLNFGADDFTIEGWMLPYSNNYGGLFAKRATCSSNYGPAVLQLSQDTAAGATAPRLMAFMPNAGHNGWEIQHTTQLPLRLGEWNHIALVRHGAKILLYVNGQRDTVSTGYNHTVQDTTADLTIGAPAVSCPNWSQYWGFDGLLDEWRVTIGEALYTSTTITVPTHAFPNP